MPAIVRASPRGVKRCGSWRWCCSRRSAPPPPQVHSEPLAGHLPPLDEPDARGPDRFGPAWSRCSNSPMGEPFRGPRSSVRISVRIGPDANQRRRRERLGRITSLDADRFFLLLDREHDGEIDPGVIDDYYERCSRWKGRSRGGVEDAARSRAAEASGGGHARRQRRWWRSAEAAVVAVVAGIRGGLLGRRRCEWRRRADLARGRIV